MSEAGSAQDSEERPSCKGLSHVDQAPYLAVWSSASPVFRLFEQHELYLEEGLFTAYNQWIFGATQNLANYQSWTSTHAEEYAAFTKFQQGRLFKIPDG